MISWVEDTSTIEYDEKKEFPKYQQNQQDVIKLIFLLNITSRIIAQ